MLDTITLLFKENVGAATVAAAIVSVIGMVVGAVLNNVFQRSRLRKEQKVRFQDVIGEKIAGALLQVRDLELRARTYEFYDMENRLEDGAEDINFLDPEGTYPAIMNDADTFLEFTHELNEARGKYERYLSDEVAAYLWYGANNFANMSIFIGELGMANNYPGMGTIFLFDVLNWQNGIEKEIVKAINKHSTKVVVHKGLHWERAKKKVEKKLKKKSILNHLKNNPDGDIGKMVYEVIDSFRASEHEDIQELEE